MNLHLHTRELLSGDRFELYGKRVQFVRKDHIRVLAEPEKGIMWAPIPAGMWDVTRNS